MIHALGAVQMIAPPPQRGGHSHARAHTSVHQPAPTRRRARATIAKFAHTLTNSKIHSAPRKTRQLEHPPDNCHLRSQLQDILILFQVNR